MDTVSGILSSRAGALIWWKAASIRMIAKQNDSSQHAAMPLGYYNPPRSSRNVGFWRGQSQMCSRLCPPAIIKKIDLQDLVDSWMIDQNAE